MPRALAAYLAAVAVTTLLGSALQTQFNLAQLAGLGLAIPARLRAAVTVQDLAGFAPNFGALVAAAFVIALPVASLLARRLASARGAVFALAGAAAVAAMLLIMQAVLGLTAIAAARGAAGFAALVLAGAAGGWSFAALSAPRA